MTFLDAALARRSAPPVVVLKGNGAAHHLGAWALRGTRDIDLLPADPEQLIAHLTEVGYRQALDRMPHEAGVMVAPDRRHIDVHRYFPVWHYPPPKYHVSDGNGRTRMAGWMTCDGLGHDVVIRHVKPHPAGRHGKMLVPDATLTALIICLHVFKDYVERPLSKKAATQQEGRQGPPRGTVRASGFDPAAGVRREAVHHTGR